MEDIITIAIILVAVACAVFYIYRAKKKGKKCIGCPDGCSCDSKNSQCSCCSRQTNKK